MINNKITLSAILFFILFVVLYKTSYLPIKYNAQSQFTYELIKIENERPQNISFDELGITVLEKKIDGNNILLKNVFLKPTPCNVVNYTIVKNMSVINIIPQDMTPEYIDKTSGCATVISYDIIKINIFLPNGEYTLNTYSWWNKQKPAISEKIII